MIEKIIYISYDILEHFIPNNDKKKFSSIPCNFLDIINNIFKKKKISIFLDLLNNIFKKKKKSFPKINTPKQNDQRTPISHMDLHKMQGDKTVN